MGISHSKRTLRNLAPFFVILLASLIAAFSTINNQSFWLDEFDTIRVANVEVFSDWVPHYLAESDSNLQMPLYHAYVYAWSKLFGLSEYTIRLANLPLYVLGLLALAWTMHRNILLATSVIIVAAFHPLIWYYLNEARPYTMLYASTLMVCSGLYGLYSKYKFGSSPFDIAGALILFCFGVVLMAGASMLGMLWSFSAVLVATWLWRASKAHKRLTNTRLMILLISGVIMCGLSVFYLSTVLHGVQSTAHYGTNLKTILYDIYEIAGLGGLGPGRLALRYEGVKALEGYWLAIGIAGVVVFATTLYALTFFVRMIGMQFSAALLIVIGIPVFTTIITGYMTGWRVLGRHLIPATALYALLVGFGLSHLLASQKRWATGWAFTVVTVILLSAFSYQAPRHTKEDYRQASAMAMGYAKEGKSVWWAANEEGGQFYGLSVQRPTAHLVEGDCKLFHATGNVVYVGNLESICLAKLAPPEIVILSRPDIFDQENILSDTVGEYGYQPAFSPQGFKVWKRPVDLDQKNKNESAQLRS